MQGLEITHKENEIEQINYFDESALEIDFLNETITTIEIYIRKIKEKLKEYPIEEKIELFQTYMSKKNELTRIRSRMALHRRYKGEGLKKYLYDIEDDLYHLEYDVITFYESIKYTSLIQ